GLGGRADLEDGVDICLETGADFDRLEHLAGEALRRNPELVLPAREVGESVGAIGLRGGTPDVVGGEVANFQAGAGNDRAGRIYDQDIEAASGGRGLTPSCCGSQA